jgi:hypothetical protein
MPMAGALLLDIVQAPGHDKLRILLLSSLANITDDRYQRVQSYYHPKIRVSRIGSTITDKSSEMRENPR